jgi:hypothetical protein
MLTGKPGQLPAGPIESDQVYHRLRHLITAGK